LDLENVINTISRRSFLAEVYNNRDCHPIIPVVEMMYSRDSNVCRFDPNDVSLMHSKVLSRTGVPQEDPRGPLMFNLAIITRSGILGNGAMIIRRSNPFVVMESI
jgi:hypothetical protein